MILNVDFDVEVWLEILEMLFWFVKLINNEKLQWIKQGLFFYISTTVTRYFSSRTAGWSRLRLYPGHWSVSVHQLTHRVLVGVTALASSCVLRNSVLIYLFIYVCTQDLLLPLSCGLKLHTGLLAGHTVLSRLACGQCDVRPLSRCHVMYLLPYCVGVTQYIFAL